MTACNLRSLLVAAIFISNCITWTTSRHHFTHSISGHRIRHRRQGAGQYLSASYVLPGGEGSGWGEWGEISPCSRTCGGGVASQKRICLQIGPDDTPYCTGGSTKYFSCQTQDCPDGSEDFRAQQCAEFDDKDFRGFKYKWVPYIHVPNTCELTCMPQGERFYYRHKEKVVDGTRCNEDSFDVCVNGQCQPVGCDMMLGSKAVEDKCRVCRGNGDSCRTYNGIYDRQDLTKGYNDLMLIPEGSTTITIEEVAPSRNYLALRAKNGTFYLNGHYHIDFPRTMMIAGAFWNYERSPQGYMAPDRLRTLGPTTEPLILSLLLQDENVGIQYEYSVPNTTAPPTDRQYHWVHEDFTPCSAACGGGIQTRNVSCRTREELDIVNDGLCEAGLKPQTSQACNPEPCPAQWVPAGWGNCSKRCGEGGVRSREVRCEQIVANGHPSSIIDDNECLKSLGPKPDLFEKCNENVSCPTWFVGKWKNCDRLCDEGKQKRQVVCHQKVEGRVTLLSDEDCVDEKPETEKPCFLYPCEGADWVTSKWIGCDSCLSTNRTRAVVCATTKRVVLNDSFCSLHNRPAAAEPCDPAQLPECEVQWYATQWSSCSVECGEGQQTRKVFCGLFDGEAVQKVADSKCAGQPRYNDTKPCVIPKEKCPSQWFAGPWEKCSKECDGGERKRTVMCFKGDQPAKGCDSDSIPEDRENCNTQPCNEDTLLPVNPSAPSITTQQLPFCDDEDYPEVGLDTDFVELGGSMQSDSPKGITTYSEFESSGSGWGVSPDFEYEGSGFTPFESDNFTDSSTTNNSTATTFDYSTTEGTATTSNDTTEENSTGDDENVTTSAPTSVEDSTTTAQPGNETTSTDESDTNSTATEPDSSVTTASPDPLTTKRAVNPEYKGDLVEEPTTLPTTLAGNETTSTDDSDTNSTTAKPDPLSTTRVINPEYRGDIDVLHDISTTAEPVTTSNDTASTTDGTTGTGTDITTTANPETTLDSNATTIETETKSTSNDTVSTTDVTPSNETTTTGVAETTTDRTTPQNSTETTVTDTTVDSNATTAEPDSTSNDTVSTTDVTPSNETTTTDVAGTTTDRTTPENSTETTVTEVTVDSNATTVEPDSTSNDTASTTDVTPSNETTATDVTETTTDRTTPENSTETTVTETTLDSNTTTVETESTSNDTASTTDVTPSNETTTTSIAETTTDRTTPENGTETTITETTVDINATTVEPDSTSNDTASTTDVTPSNDTTTTGVAETTTDRTTPENGTETTVPETTADGNVTTVEPDSTSNDTASTTDVTPNNETTTTGVAETTTDRTTLENGTETTVTGSTTESGETSTASSGSNETESTTAYTGSEATTLDSNATTEYTGSTTESGASTATSAGNETDSTAAYTGSETTVASTGSEETSTSAGNETETTTGYTGSETTEYNATTEATGSTTETGESSAPTSTDTGSTQESTTAEYSTTTESTGSTESEGTASTSTGSTETGSTTEFSTTENTASTTEGVTGSDLTSTSPVWIFSTPQLQCIPRVRKCKNSAFGCCPDKKTPATGPFDQGCPRPKTCNETTHGCCPDGVSVAAGPDGEGCPTEACADTIFGCCLSDNKTAAEGNDQEGCPPPCVASEFGCCADNDTEAIGPEKEGCPESSTTAESTTLSTTEATTAESTETEISTTEETTTEFTTEIPFEDCADSEFGCCFDNETAATSADAAGCPCNATQFGCCPDGVSPAQGAHLEGCQGDCRSSKFGCCSDGQTPAHGPDFEGCCLLEAYGCCPDNRKPAEGPHLEGCGCQYASYGCCPDNVTPAQGPDNQGCGCQYTTHGCCPDKHTEASGPNFEGCSCSTFQFGCCEDGVTRAYGPGKQGCHCQHSEFGCCGDQKTHATGPNGAGCDCSNSKFGCCADGKAEASGPKFLGCTDVPDNPQASCGLPADQGSCGNYTMQWFYDAEYGGCSRFWYGGCGGNNNRFRSKEDCEDVCVQPAPKDSCKLPSVKGSCPGDFVRWYYNSSHEQCAPFRYGGCLGNDNNFETRELCQARCEPDRTTDQCSLPIETGPCAGNYSRWGYDKASDSCQQFTWGGCEGNHNRFGSEAACLAHCRPPGTLAQPDKCTLPAETGDCANYREKWFYDTAIKICRLFYYGGCGGNENNFDSEVECQNTCSQAATTTVATTTTTFRPSTTAAVGIPAAERADLCLLEIDAGPCNNAEQRWGYDEARDRCVPFQYGGCGGNQNNFLYEYHCLYYCKPAQDICQLPMQTGPCDESQMRWFYDPASDSCSQFTYGGCDGNENRFESREECEGRCKVTVSTTTPIPVQPPEQVNAECVTPPSLEPCGESVTVFYFDSESRQCVEGLVGACNYANSYRTHEECERRCGEFSGLSVEQICTTGIDPGPCRGSFQKFYWDHVRGRCDVFAYGGCRGGPNRFDNIDECEEVCGGIGPDTNEVLDCGAYDEECARLQCEHGVTRSSTGDGCERCACAPPPVDCEPLRHECEALDCPFGLIRTPTEEGCESCQCAGDPCASQNCGPTEVCITERITDSATRDMVLNARCIPVDENEIVPDCSPYAGECELLRCPYGVQKTRLVNGCERCSCITTETNCDILTQECEELKCTYGLRRSPDAYGCIKCQCDPPPCQDEVCNEGERCVVITYRDAVTLETRYSAECRANIPRAPEPVAQQEPEVSASEGGKATLRCVFHGNPPPKITWSYGEVTIDGDKDRYRLLSDGSLEIVSLYRTDSGVYVCVADNGLGTARQSITLIVKDPVETPVGIAGDEDAVVVGELGRPLAVRCLAYGYPSPMISWIRESDGSMVPFNNAVYEARGNILLIRRLDLHALDYYTCQAYNGYGKPASWTVAIKAFRPEGYVVENRFLVARAPVIVNRIAPPAWEPQPTTTTTTTTEKPRMVFKIPVSTHIAPPAPVSAGEDLQLTCEVDGYPDPTVIWTKDGARLQDDGRITTSGSVSVFRLTVSRVTAEDAGEYACHATNEYSEHSDSTRVTVNRVLTIPAKCTDNPFFANCDLIVRSNYCKHKYYSKFCCKSCVEAGQLDPQEAEMQADQPFRRK